MPRSHRRRKTKRSRPERVSPHTLFSRRLTVLTSVFVAIALVYCGILISLQARGNAYSIYVESPSVPTGGTVQTVTLQAVRGEIYDRNGKPLVTNVYSYDLTLDHTAFTSVGGTAARNALLLSLLDAMTEAQSDAALSAELFPLEGTYPRLAYSDEALIPDSPTAKGLSRVLENVRLDENASADALITYYVNTYGLNTQSDGIPDYTGEQITALLRLYYDMDRNEFSAVTPYTLAKGVPTTLISTLREASTPAVSFAVRAERVCHYPGYATHLLGRVGQIFAEDWAYYNAMGYPMNAIVGVSGCESAFESILHGTDGEMQITLDAEGHTISTRVITPAIAGQDIRLTIDIDLQIAAEDALRASMTADAEQGTLARGKAGSVVAMDTATGEYLALASAPSYDAARFGELYDSMLTDPSLPMLNRALSTPYEIGALSQLITAVGVLSEGTVHSWDMMTDSGTFSLGKTVLICPLYEAQGHTHGTVSVATAMREGCTPVFGQLGTQLGNYRYSLWESALGIGQSTGIELVESTGASAGIYPGVDAQVAAAAAGQSSAKATPAQLCALLSTVLRGGDRPSGHLLLEIRDFTSGEAVYRKPSESLSYRAISADHVSLLTQAMRTNANLTSALSDAVTTARGRGMALGSLSSASSGNALALVLATPMEGVDSVTESTLAVSAVLEGALTKDDAARVAAQALSDYLSVTTP